MEQVDILIVGGGAAGLSAAKAAKGASVLLVDRRPQLGGILPQCAHRGFRKHQNGPECAAELISALPPHVAVLTDTTVLSVSRDRTAILSGKAIGRREVRFSRLILAAGCREIPAGALPIGGTRPGGVFTAGDMQARMNLHGQIPEGPAVILGGGDIGLIMAKQLAEAGIEVTVVEQRERCGAMARNRRCLEEFPIRLLCGDTVTELRGERELCGCVTKSGAFLPCRTLLIAAGLKPERELTAHLGDPEWLTLCGNCNQVHPTVETVIQEGFRAGTLAAEQMR